MSDASPSTTLENVSPVVPGKRGEAAAKYLVAFILAINVCFSIYMVVQFFVAKPYGNGLHAGYSAIVLATMILLAVSTRGLWRGDTRMGACAFFAAIAVSMVGNLVASLFA